jgi:glycosyltransferase involved in cell wall biosynthesis
MKFTIVIPAFNEEKSIASTIEKTTAAGSEIVAQALVDNVTIVVVSDGSTDRTTEIASGFKGIQLIAYEKNRGYGAAIKTGFAQTDDELVGFLDADGTCDPFVFIALLKKQQETKADVVLGSRLGENSRMTLLRRIGNVFFATLINLWAGTRIKDPASGMRVIQRSSLLKLYPLPDGLHFTPAMSAKAIFNRDIVIEEISMPYEERIGESKLSVVHDGIRFLRAIIETAIVYRPRRLFNLVGLLMIIVALFLAVSPVQNYLASHNIEDRAFYRLLMIVLLVNAGILLLGLGFISQRFLELLHYRKAVTNENLPLFESLLLNHGLILGLSSLVSSLLFFYKPLLQFIGHSSVSVNWFSVLAGSFFFWLGFQLISFGVMGIIFTTVNSNLKELN